MGGGEVTFTCPSVRAVKSGFDFTNMGRISKIRGIAYVLSPLALWFVLIVG